MSSKQSALVADNPNVSTVEAPLYLSNQDLIYNPDLAVEMDPTDNPVIRRPIIPPFRTSADGRIAVDLDHGDRDDDGSSPADWGHRFFLLAPETHKFSMWPDPMISPGGPQIVAQAPGLNDGHYAPPSDYAMQPYDEVWWKNAPGVSYDGKLTHQAICDPTPTAPLFNPHPCGTAAAQGALANEPTDASKDCYTLTMISSLDRTGRRTTLFGRKFTAIVTNPKTDVPSLELTVDANTPAVEGHTFVDVPRFRTPSITGDGRVIVAKIGKETRTPKPGIPIDVVYSYSSAACDVTGWTVLKPMSEAFDDPNVNTTYGFAMQPFRDSSGAVIAKGQDLEVSYPWIDREGNNLFFTSLRSTLYYQDQNGAIHSRYTATCGQPYSCPQPWNASNPTTTQIARAENTENFTGVGVAGLWTNGKMVLLDNAINNVDYGMGTAHQDVRLLSLYPYDSIYVNSGRYAAGLGDEPMVDSVRSMFFLDSLEHRMFFQSKLVPYTVRDVVWSLDTGKGSVEVAFDDYLDRRLIVFAEMSGALTHNPVCDRSIAGSTCACADVTTEAVCEDATHMSTCFWNGAICVEKTMAAQTYHDGFVQTGPTVDQIPDLVPATVTSHDDIVWFQNSSTSSTTGVPPAGVSRGSMRLEPVALGGIEGKGAWMDGVDDAIDFTIGGTALDDMKSHVWYASAFIDPRFSNDGVSRTLFALQSTLRVRLVGQNTVRVETWGGSEIKSFDISNAQLHLSSSVWSHLAVVFDYQAGTLTKVKLYVNGYRFAAATPLTAAPFGCSTSCTFTAGVAGTGSGFRGWIDEVKLMTYEPNSELACNHARGTLMEVTGSGWDTLASAYPTLSHNLVMDDIGPNGYMNYYGEAAPQHDTRKYVCYIQWRDADPTVRAHRSHTAPAGLRSVRHLVNFPKGPLHWNKVRPDSQQNQFCLTCHHSAGKRHLDVANALAQGTQNMWLDPRRQPSNPPATIYGNLPANYFGPGLPAQPATGSGTAIDKYMFP